MVLSAWIPTARASRATAAYTRPISPGSKVAPSASPSGKIVEPGPREPCVPSLLQQRHAEWGVAGEAPQPVVLLGLLARRERMRHLDGTGQGLVDQAEETAARTQPQLPGPRPDHGPAAYVRLPVLLRAGRVRGVAEQYLREADRDVQLGDLVGRRHPGQQGFDPTGGRAACPWAVRRRPWSPGRPGRCDVRGRSGRHSGGSRGGAHQRPPGDLRLIHTASMASRSRPDQSPKVCVRASFVAASAFPSRGAQRADTRDQPLRSRSPPPARPRPPPAAPGPRPGPTAAEVWPGTRRS